MAAGRAGRGAQPVAPDIPPKSGRNYAFGPDDLTYEGSWRQKAEANVEAVELLNKLQAEGRQATADEQRVLARFVGWGASDLANNLFGKKLDEVDRLLGYYDSAVESMKQLGRDYLRKGSGKRGDYSDNSYYDAALLLRAKQGVSPGAIWQYPERITRADIDSARPTAGDRKWVELRDRLKAALTPQEWEQASRSTQYAHYTSKEIVRSMWAAVERMGFAGGQILEPGAGIGVFPGLMPQAMAQNSVYTGIEFDSVTGGILQQLFPDERIRVESFVDSKLPRDYYDVAIGNPPFAGWPVLADPEYEQRAFTLHDYFFAKSLDRVKPGGLMVYVTSRYTMDKLDDKARKYMAERADLLGAIRLPQTAFLKNAGTEVVTDVLFLRKRKPGEAPRVTSSGRWLANTNQRGEAVGEPVLRDLPSWSKSVPIKVNGAEFPINEYFVAHPEMVLGQHSDTGKMYKERSYTVTPPAGDIEALFRAAVERLPENVYRPERGSAGEAAVVREIDFNPRAQKEGGLYVTDAGIVMQRENGVGVRVHEKLSKQTVEIVRDYVPLRDALKQAHYDQLNDGDWETSLAALQRAYKKFVAARGNIRQWTARVVKAKAIDEETGESFTEERTSRVETLDKHLRDDPDWTLVRALENLDEDTGKITPSDFLSRRVLGKRPERQIVTAGDALLSSLNDVGKVDVALIAQRLGMSPADAVEALGPAIYEDPEAGWQTSDEYLSGNVKRKLEVAREAAQTDRRYERNVAALEAAQPRPRTPSEINAALGMNWIPGEVYEKFLNDLTGARVAVRYNDAAGKWIVTTRDGGDMRAQTDWGTSAAPAPVLLEHGLTGAPIKINRDEWDGNNKKRVFDAAATEAANAKLGALRERFATWLWEDGQRADALVRIYNDKFNTTVARQFDGRHLTLPGASLVQKVHDHVKRGAWRIVQTGNTYLAHAVGAGKTWAMVISAMEQKRLGLIDKPMVVVPNHMLAQFSAEWRQLYPAARLMVADEQNFHTDNRRRFVSQVALSDLDGVIITHSAFKLLDVDPDFKAQIIEEHLDAKRAALQEAEDEAKAEGNKKSVRVKQIERQIERLEQRLKAAISGKGKDQNARFDELGVDFVYVDEAHEFRKLDFTTARQVKGIDPMGSDKALDLYTKKRWLESKRPGRSLVLASGTPVTNTMAELYTVQRMLAEQTLRERGLHEFDAWASMFGRESTSLEPNAGGQYEPVTRFNKFVNVPEMTQMFREFADVLTSDDLAAILGDKRPKVDGGSRRIEITPKLPALASYQRGLAMRVEQSRKWKPSKEQPNNPDPIIAIIGDGRLASIDMRFVDPGGGNDPDSKLNRMLDDVIKVWGETADWEYAGRDGKPEPNRGASMMVFSDLGFGAGVAAHRGFNARAWAEKRLRDAGIPRSQFAFMSDYKQHDKKKKLFADVNAGRVRILIGSSKNMGTGVNAQQRLAALFHLDSPWYPADLEQREGRIIRQGNKNPTVRIFAYATKGTYDENMWQMLARKQRFIDQALSGDDTVREIEDLDSQSQYELVAALTADDPRVLQLAGAKSEVAKLQRMQQAHEQQRMEFRQRHDSAAMRVSYNEKKMAQAEEAAGKVRDLSSDNFTARAGKSDYSNRADWAGALLGTWKDLSSQVKVGAQKVGEISGFDANYVGEMVGGNFTSRIELATPGRPVLHATFMGATSSPLGMAMRAQNAVADVAREPQKMRDEIARAKAEMDALSTRLDTPFPMAETLAERMAEAARIEAELAAEGKAKPGPGSGEQADDGAGRASKNTKARAGRAFASRVGEPDNGVSILSGVSDGVGEAYPSVGGASREGSVLWARAAYDDGRVPDGWWVHGRAGRSDLNTGNVIQLTRSLDVADSYAGNRGSVWFVRPKGGARVLDLTDEDGADADKIVSAAVKDFNNGSLPFLSDIEDSIGREAEEYDVEDAVRSGFSPEKIVESAGAFDNAEWVNWLHDKTGAQFVLLPNEGAVALDQESGIEAVPVRGAGKVNPSDSTRRSVSSAAYSVADALDAITRRFGAGRTARLLAAGERGDRGGVIVVASQAEAKDRLAAARGGRPLGARTLQSLGDELNGFYDPEIGLTFIVAQNSGADAAAVLTHELGVHYWLDSVPADKRTAIVDRAVDLITRGEDDVARAARQRMRDAGVLTDDGVVLDREEAWAYLAEEAERARAAGKTLPARVAQWVRDMLAAVRAAMVRGGLSMVVKIGAPELAAIARANVRAAALNAERRAQGGERSAADDAERQARWLAGEARFRGYKDVDDMSARNPTAFANLTALWRKRNPATVLRSVAGAQAKPAAPQTPAQRAEAIIQKPVTRARPVDWVARMASKYSGLDWIAGRVYRTAGALLDRLTPETVKAGVVSDYGVPEAVIDQRVLMQGRQRVQLRRAGSLLEKLATLTRAESRALYEWMNNEGDPAAGDELVAALPEESRQAVAAVQRMIESLSQEAVAQGQLSADAYRRHRYAYLRRSYEKHVLADAPEKSAWRSKALTILGDQYRGRGLVQPATMGQMRAAAPEWWGRKLAGGRADARLVGERFVRLERHRNTGAGTAALDGVGDRQERTRALEVAYWPAGEQIPTKYEGWTRADAWEVRDVRGDKLVLWRDFTRAEREQMGEIDDARFAIAKTLQGMIHDVEAGRYLEWVARNHGKVEGDAAVGPTVEASERAIAAFAPGTWVKVPDTKVQGTDVRKYGALAGKYIPGPVWNDVRQVVNGDFRPLGETYATVLRWWKTAKTALSPAVHTNNVMANVVMADWHDVGAAHIGKSLRILLAAANPQGGLIAAAGRGLRVAGGIADREAAVEIVNRYKDSGGEIGSWASRELEREQMEPLLEALEREVAARGESPAAMVTAGAAIQAALAKRLGKAGELTGKAGAAAGKAVVAEGRSMIDLYQSEDDIFRLATWLKAKEEGATDVAAGKTARRSFLDYNINAPWIQAARATAFPFIGFTYRAVPMLLETAGKKPHKLFKLMAMAGLLNALGVAMGGGDDDEVRKLLPEEKAGRVWGIVPKLIRMPWNDQHGSPVYLDIRRWIPVGDVVDVGQGQAALPLPPAAYPGGPLVLVGEVLFNKSAFTGRPITLETDSLDEKAAKVGGHLYRGLAPNIVGLPGTFATQGVLDAASGRTDVFGRERSVPAATASAFGVKLGAYPPDVLRRNQIIQQNVQINELERERARLRRQLQTRAIDPEEFDAENRKITEKMREVRQGR